MKSILSGLAAGILLASCATMQPAASNDSQDEKVYTTGSRIPRAQHPNGTVSEVSKEEMERIRDQARTNSGRGLGG